MEELCSRRSTRSLIFFLVHNFQENFQKDCITQHPHPYPTYPNLPYLTLTLPYPTLASYLRLGCHVKMFVYLFSRTAIHLKYFELSLIESVSRSTNFKSSLAINSRLDSKLPGRCSSIFPFSSSTENENYDWRGDLS